MGIIIDMEQLVLLDTRESVVDTREGDWRLDERVKQVGREGIKAARAALAAAERHSQHRSAA